jgi:hypothetical protein
MHRGEPKNHGIFTRDDTARGVRRCV